jgi:DNA replication licensing factor MCM4
MPNVPQESPNDIPEGETPMGVTLYAYDTLVDVPRPGDRVTITGMYRAAAIRANPRQAALHALFRTYVDVVHIHRDETRRLFSQANGANAKAEASRAGSLLAEYGTR